MSQHKDEVYLRHMRDYATEALHITENKIREDLDNDAVLRYALLHLICIIGEAANLVSADGREKLNTIPWRAIISMRNRLIHGYDLVDLDVLWATITEDVPELIRLLDETLKNT